MTSLYGLLLQSSGLSEVESASLHKMPYETVAAWSHGTAAPSDEALRFLYRLIDLQNHAAHWVLHMLKQESETASRRIVTICITDDENQSGTLGWPTASAMNAAVRRLLEIAGDDLRSRIQLVFNPEPGEPGVHFVGTRLRPDGTPEAPGQTTDE
ncbi:hypothetical protein LB533_25810 [Mesorhizobium sp. BR1-1-13]|uniref:hypothetical protein n=1 Tax=Mesorhizobium sp. BR1-1-13 TaxID=2876656 RepID=UPI001CD0A6F5|nr:hypothetical protein [Mesorhizobium sp. BR1-1-13]MBZ9944515.1 hypothetical protein [Mesorhizobium sp. BR1-1-13]